MQLPLAVRIFTTEGIPFEQYVSMMQESDVILDQLYSYTPAMNALEAMSHGLVVVGGGEPENYEILHETELHPIINVLPTYESVYHELEKRYYILNAFLNSNSKASHTSRNTTNTSR